MSHDMSRRTFLKFLGGGLAGVAAGGAFVKREDILAFLDADKAAGEAGTDLGKVTTRYYSPWEKICPSLALAVCAYRRLFRRRVGKSIRN